MAATTNTEEELKRLHDQVAVLISKNLELQRRLDEFERENTGLTVASIGASLVNAIREAEAAIADESQGDTLYVVSELQASLRGFLSRQDVELTLRLPRSERTVPPDNLESLQMTLKPVPPRILPDAVVVLARTLETVHLTFSSRSMRTGETSETAVAEEITDLSSYLLDNMPRWQEESFAQALKLLAGAAIRLARMLQEKVPPESAERHRTITENLVGLADRMGRTRTLTIEDIEPLAVILQDFTGMATPFV